MPIYEYQCSACHHQFDVMQKMNDAPIKICPACSKETIVRLVSAAGFQLKGTGWYATDFKDKGKPKPLVNASESSGSETKTTTTSDSKGGDN